MGFWSGARKTLLPFASAKEWFNFSQVKESTDTLLMLVRRYLVPNSKLPETEQVSFEEVCARYQLDEAGLMRLRRNFLRLTWFFVVIGALALCYTGYLLSLASFRAGLISVVITCLALVMAFRYHFWWYQVKTRKLGCTFQEWLHGAWFSG